ncbi:hypothetical protein Mal15_38220 [Stieleria maiorica]|uniref:Uncharacterized protein n=1 Tax=Stieleria maiorica TaxID=2795974 RepID=A0A5B9MID8_9BACT|nr:hypothetical protein [Stieleria maiorica]QEF99756.1 hypothetical protein Mal15_38220 [Stieleria maiorica]
MLRDGLNHSSQFPKRAIVPPAPIPATWDAMVKAEPRLLALEQRARSYRGDRDIWDRYSLVKASLSRLVGWECHRRELADTEHYRVALDRICEALGV